MKKPAATILALSGGASSIKFALFESRAKLKRIFGGTIDGVGQPK